MTLRDQIVQQAMTLPPQDREYVVDLLERSLSNPEFRPDELPRHGRRKLNGGWQPMIEASRLRLISKPLSTGCIRHSSPESWPLTSVPFFVPFSLSPSDSPPSLHDRFDFCQLFLGVNAHRFLDR